MPSSDALKFLRSIADNNNREWFENNREWFDRVKEEFENWAEKVLNGLCKIDGDVAELSVKKCTFRQYRDVRFSKDKRPYKNNMGVYFNKGGKKLNTAGYYFHLEPGKSIIAGGLWMPEGPQLSKVRQEIDYNYEEWKRIINKPSFKKIFPDGLSTEDTLTRPPKGYDEANPAIESLKLKSFIARHSVTDKEIANPELAKHTIAAFKELKPLVNFLNRAAD